MQQGTTHNAKKDQRNKSQGLNKGFNVPKITYVFALFAEIWERLWPLLVWTFICACTYAIFSWAGLWRQLDEIYRIGLLSLFTISALISLYPLRKLAAPSHNEVLSRIENASNLEDRPLTAQNDNLATGRYDDEPSQNDKFSYALWLEHKNRMASHLEDLSSGAPRPNANILDKFALRAMLPIIAFIVWGFSFGSMGGSLLDGFSKHIDKAQILSRLDVWANSPAYTGRAPIYISNKSTAEEITHFKLLNGSTFNLRYLGNEEVSAQYKIGSDITKIPKKLNEKSGGIDSPEFKKFELSHPLTKSGEFQFLANEIVISSWNMEIETDQAPTISFVENPKSALAGSLELTYSVKDLSLIHI